MELPPVSPNELHVARTPGDIDNFVSVDYISRRALDHGHVSGHPYAVTVLRSWEEEEDRGRLLGNGEHAALVPFH